MRTKDELLTVVVDAFLGEVVLPPSQRLPRHWRPAITVVATRSRDALRRHPWILDITDDPKIGPNATCSATSGSGLQRSVPYDSAVVWSDSLSLAKLVTDAMDGDPGHALARWAASGAMQLTGMAAGPPLAGPARVALALDALAARVAELSAELGDAVNVDGGALLGERAALAGLVRQGAVSCGQGCHLLEASDGWIGLSLVREADVELLDAWLGTSLGIDISVPVGAPVWSTLAETVRGHRSVRLIEQASLLGLPCAHLGEMSDRGDLVEVGFIERDRRARRRLDSLTVVDLSALWAGPLCAQLLGSGGARVVKIESCSRPDGARYGPQDFFDLLHAGHESVALDFTAPHGRRTLRALLLTADVVIEASRPRALETLGVSFDVLRDDGWRGVWLSITGYGRTGHDARRVAFGDDAAVAGGLIAGNEAAPVFCADAIADPTTGLLAAAAVLSAIDAGITGHIAVSLARTAAHLAAGVRRHPTIAPAPDVVAAPPRSRSLRGRAATLGTHTDEVLRSL